MSATLIPFTPNQLTGFAFQVSLTDINGAIDPYNVNVLWNTFSQRWYMTVSASDGTVAITLPLIESPDDYDINLVAGSSNPFFTSSVVFRYSKASFEVTT